MADETFSYTGATTLTFATSGHSIDDSDGIRFNQIVDRTIGGVQMVKNLGDNYNVWEYTVVVPLSSGAETDWDDVKTFFGTSHVNGSQNAFTWTDYESTARTVYCMNMEIIGNPLSGAYKQITFQLEQQNT